MVRASSGRLTSNSNVKVPTSADADRGHQDGRDRGADHAGDVDCGAVQRHRVPEQIPAHDLRDERLPGRVVHRAQRAEQQRQDDDLPQPDVPGQHAHAERRRDQAEPRLGDDQRVPFGVPVDDQPGVRGQQQDRRVARRGGQAQDRAGMGQAQHQ
jgi:hypothetical protein